MASNVTICNLALVNIGQPPAVSSITPSDGSVQANICAMFYDMTLNTVLDEHNWGFATRNSALLAPVANPNSLWLYAYALPSDFINVADVLDANATDDLNGFNTAPVLGNAVGGMAAQSYSVEIDAGGNGVLYSNQANALLKYAAYVGSAAQFPPLFVEAFAWLLAARIAGGLIKGDVGVAAAGKCLNAYGMWLGKAKLSDAQNRKKPLRYVPAGIAARG